MADSVTLAMKADAEDFLGRFREIISDPLNLAIERHPLSGFTEGDCVILHNGNRVSVSGPEAYYGDFSQILIINRGVHEPLEEYVFQEVLKRLSPSPLMLELGAYWGHYSMWLKVARPDASVYLVESEEQHIKAGEKNFATNQLHGEFIRAFVGKGQFEVDAFLRERRIDVLDILHSDIQGYELDMLEGAAQALKDKRVTFLFVSTHSQELHHSVLSKLSGFGYRIEVASDFDFETTSFDGFVFASHPAVAPVFADFNPLSRLQILQASPALHLQCLSRAITRPSFSGPG